MALTIRRNGFARVLVTRAIFFLFPFTVPSFLLATNISGNISGTFTLSSSPYVVTGNIDVPSGQTLTIQPGVLIKVSSHWLFEVDGTLLAVGTSGQPIVFTSLADDSIGGDTGGDGPTIGKPNDWRDIYFNGPASSGSRLDHVVVRYGGSSESADIYVGNSSPTITNSLITNSSGNGVYANSGMGPKLIGNQFLNNASWGAAISGLSPLVSSNTFDGNGFGLYFGYAGGTPVLANNVIRNTKNQAMEIGRGDIYPQDGGGNVFEATNQENGIYMDPVTLTQSGTWGILEAPYIIRGGPVQVGTGNGSVNLTIAPGVVVKSKGNSFLYVFDTLTAVGTSSAPITFTSTRDDTVGGDSNLYEGVNSPAPGDWRDIYFNGPQTSGSRLDHVVVRYGGNSESADIYVGNSSPTITNSLITNSSGNGVLANTGMGPRLIGNQFLNNASWGAAISGLSPLVSSNTFDGNGFGLYFGYAGGTPVLANNVIRNTKNQAMEIGRGDIYPQDGGGNVFEATNQENGIYMDPVTLTQSGTWGILEAPYIIRGGPVQVGTGNGSVNLTIAPGVVVKSKGNSFLFVFDTLTAVGTSSAPITFTSTRDDTVGGDSNLYEGVNSPAPGDWRDIYFNGPQTSGSRLDHVVVRYGGNSESADIYVGNSSPTITNSLITNSSGNGVYANSGMGPKLIGNQFLNNVSWGAAISGLSPLVSSNTFDGNGGGLYFSYAAGTPAFTNNVIRNSKSQAMEIAGADIYPQDGGGNVFEATNQENGIYMNPVGLTQSGTWGILAAPYIIRAGGVMVGSGNGTVNLTIAPGVVVKFKGSSFLFVFDTLTAVGTSSAPITFTSTRDDTVGGDSNLYEGVNSPAPGDWRDIYFNGPQTSGSRLDHVVVRYGGNSESADIYVGNSSPTITNSLITNSSGNGIRIDGGRPVIQGNNLRQNPGSAITSTAGALPEIHNNNILSNGSGVSNGDATVTVNAQNNYWGAASGPSGAGPGTGDSVSVHVNFSPFETAPITAGDIPVTQCVGRILDIFGNPVPNLTISLLNDSLMTTTDASGHFSQSVSTLLGYITLSATVTVQGVQMTAQSRRLVSNLPVTDFGDVVLASSSTLSGNISGTLDPLHSPYIVIGNVTVPVGQSLTLLPGVVIKISGGLNFTVNGVLSSIGLSTNPVTITSLQDSSVGGDILRNNSVGSPGQWISFTFNNSSGTTQLSNTVIRFGQQITLSNASPQMNQVTISSMATVSLFTDFNSFPMGAGNIAFGSAANCIDLPGITFSTSKTLLNIGIPYCMRNGRVRVDGTGILTIGAGTIIKNNTFASIAMTNGGQLFSQGTTSNPVIFTSLTDDSVGGDTTSDGNVQPLGGQWGGLQFIRSGPGLLQNMIVRWGGSGPFLDVNLVNQGNQLMPQMGVMGSTLSLTSVEVSSGYYDGIAVANGSSVGLANGRLSNNGKPPSRMGLYVTGFSSVTVTGTVFDGNYNGFYTDTDSAVTLSSANFVNQVNYGLVANQVNGSVHVDGVSFSGNNNAGGAIFPGITNFTMTNSVFTKNNWNGLDVFAGTVSGPAVWPNTGGAYGLRSGRVQVTGSGSITLAAGVIVKGTTSGSIAMTNGGQLFSQGTSGSPVVFSSFRDDTVGGDTNNDGTASQPAFGEWGGLQFIRSGPGLLQNMVMRWGGVGPYLDNNLVGQGTQQMPQMGVMGSTLSLTSVEVSSGFHDGIAVANGSSVGLTNGRMINNGKPTSRMGLYVTGFSSVTVTGTVFDGNYNGFYTDTDSAVTLSSANFVNQVNYGLVANQVNGSVHVDGASFSGNNNAGGAIFPGITNFTMTNSVFTKNNWNGLDVFAGTVSGPAVWPNTGGAYGLRSGRVQVTGSGSITLAAGVIVKGTTSGSIAMTNGGQLFSQGTSGSPVVFSSFRDDTVGGDTNNDGTASQPAFGEWGGLQFIRSGPGLLQNMVMRWGGVGPFLDNNLVGQGTQQMPQMGVMGSTLSLTSVEVSSGFHDGIAVANGSSVGLTNGRMINNGKPTSRMGLYVTGFSSVTVTGTVFDGNYNGFYTDTDSAVTLSSASFVNQVNYGLVANQVNGSVHVDGASFSGNNNAGGAIFPGITNFTMTNSVFTKNNWNGLDVFAGTVSGPAVWPNTGGAYGLRSGRVQVTGSGSITLAAGVIVKGTTSGSIAMTNGGQLFSQGTSGSPVVFSSFRDDTVGGDTNNDGTASQPAFGEWGGLQFIRSGPGLLQNMVMRWGGVGPYLDNNLVGQGSQQMPMMDVKGSTLSINQVVVSSAYLSGLDGTFGASVTVSSCVFGYNATGMSFSGGSQGTIHNSSIAGNRSNGVTNGDSAVTIDATFDYWGSTSGPTNTGNPGGTGDKVSSFVQYIPFLTAPAGGVSESSDNLPPRTKLAPGAPHGGTNPVVVSSITPISFNVVDDRSLIGDAQGVGVQQTQYSVDGGSFSVFAAPFFLSGPATHTISFFSKDLLSHVEVTTSAVVVVDLTPPITQITFSTTPFVDASSRTFISGTAQVGFAAQDSTTTIAFTQVAKDTTTFTTYSSPFTLQGGTHTISYRSQDAVGNLEAAKSFALSVDTAAPISKITVSPMLGTLPDGSILISSQTFFVLTATDPVSGGVAAGLRDVQVAIDAQPFQAFVSSFQITQPGIHTIRWFSRDNVLNTEVITSTTAVITLGCVTAPSGIVAWWPGDNSGQDISGGNSVTASGNATFAPGEVGAAFKMVQSGDNFIAPDTATIHLQQLTVEAWVNATGAGGSGTDAIGGVVAVKVLNDFPHVAPFNSWTVNYQPTSGQFLAQISPGVVTGAGSEYLQSSTGFAAGQWHHVAMTYDGTTQKLFVDGSLQAQKAIAGPIQYSTIGRLGIGGHAFGSYPFDRTLIGEVDELAIFNRALSSAEIMNIFIAGGAGRCKPSASGPKTTLTFGTPLFIDVSSHVFVSSGTPLGFTVDTQGIGTAFTRFGVDSLVLSPYASPFTLSGGSHTIRFQSQDLLGNLESLRSATVTADTAPPVAQIVFAPQAAFDNANNILITTATAVILQFQDALSGTATVQYSLDSGALQLYQSSFTLPTGTHTIGAQAFDHIGYLRTVAPFTVLVGTSAPASNGPAGGSLPDGTPIIVSPDPITVLPPIGGDTGGTGTAAPIVKQITLSPVSPVGRGTLTIKVQFSKPMNNTVNPVVTMAPQGQSPVAVAQASYVGDTWTGTVQIIDTMNSGVASLVISGAEDALGQPISTSLSTFQINIVLPAVPVNVLAKPAANQVQITWQPGIGALPASYNLYRTTYSVTSRLGLVPLATGLTATNATDLPSADVPAVYYALTEIDSLGAEGKLSTASVVAMPLVSTITKPTGGTNVDFSSTVIQGLAQPGALIDLSSSISTGTLATVTVSSSGFYSALLNLGHGPFTVSARTRSAVTGQVSAAVSVTFNVIDFPIAATGLQATAGDTTISLAWTANSQPTVIGYNIYRDNAVKPLNATPLSVGQTSFQDLALTDGRAYSYVITSVDNLGIESQPSAPVSATPVAGPGWGN